MKKIADISHYQGKINWNMASKELEFVIFRASVGTNTDQRYKDNVKGAEQYSVPYHAYHFVKATGIESAKKEALIFSKATEGTRPISYVLDAEYSGIKASKARDIMNAFEKELRRLKGNDILVGVYIGHHLYKSWALDYDHYDFVWIPRYQKSDNGKPTGKKPDYPCDLWQYTSNGTVEGIDGRVDLNMLVGDKPLAFFIGKNTNQPEKSEEKKEEENPVNKQTDEATLLGKRTLKKGCTGDDVKELQKGLTAMHYDIGKSGADGDFGPATRSAVVGFQRKNGLEPDGIFGPLSYEKWKEVTLYGDQRSKV